jgi:hypothetical protein
MLTAETIPQLSDRSIETGHCYDRTVRRGHEHMVEYFDQVKYWVTSSREIWVAQQALRTKTPDAVREPTDSLVFMYDDCNVDPGRRGKPTAQINLVLGAAATAGITIDYIVRESAYIPAAQRAIERLEHGWVRPTAPSRPSVPPGKGGSIYMDAQLCDLPDGINPKEDLLQYKNGSADRRSWACPTLATMWQLHRLGRLGVLTGYTMPDPVPYDASASWNSWDEVPPILQCNLTAYPFAARRTLSIMPSDFVEVEAGVRLIVESLNHATPIPIAPLQPAKQIEYVLLSELNDKPS